LQVVGIGPGALDLITPRALRAIAEAQVVVGYKTYIELIDNLLEDIEIISTGMTKEIDRCKAAIDKTLAGKRVVVVSSGDPGVYGMAGLILELIEKEALGAEIDLEIIPGVTSANASAARLGAPLMHDFAVVSLSDLLTPWDVILERVRAAIAADYVLVLYNPASHKRTDQIIKVIDIVKEYRLGSNPAGIVRNAERAEEEIIITDINHLLDYKIDMFSTIFIGNSNTKILGDFMVTPRGYSL
jgi:precorrin-3B C17-methyltransferase